MPSGPTSVAWPTSLETAPGAASYGRRDNIIETVHPHAPKSGRIAPDTEENNGKSGAARREPRTTESSEMDLDRAIARLRTSCHWALGR
jgi:hypothetical protein